MNTTEVRIADLKAHLSEYVRAAQGGDEIIVKDRDTPVAKLGPIVDMKWPFRIIPARRRVRGTHEMRSVRLRSLKPRDVEKALQEVREERVDRWLNLNEFTSTRR